MNSICRNSNFYKIRFLVPDHKVPWNVSWPEYNPPVYTSDSVKGSSWADPVIDRYNFHPKWNQLDGLVDRRSYDGDKQINYDVEYYPLNPKGRTGMKGRGKLGRWGPNHAGDAIVTRWKRLSDESKYVDPQTKLHVLQFLGIKRKDCGEWALPGGFVSPGEKFSDAVIREFCEECLDDDPLQKESLANFFKKGEMSYQGYVDDPRNTDNAWIETTALNFHDDDGKELEKINFKAGDDAAEAKWIDIIPDLKLYASHCDIVMKTAKMKSAI